MGQKLMAASLWEEGGEGGGSRMGMGGRGGGEQSKRSEGLVARKHLRVFFLSAYVSNKVLRIENTKAPEFWEVAKKGQRSGQSLH